MSILSNRLMLVSLNVASWSARKTDKKVSQEVAQAHAAEGGNISTRKSLVAKDALVARERIVNQARAYHYARTTPWSISGLAVISNELFLEYAETMGRFQAQAQEALDKFLEAYPQHVENARAILGTMYDSDDYPPVEEVRRRFAFSWSVAPLPEGHHLISDALSEGERELRESLATEVDEQVRESLEEATRGLWARLYDAVNAIRVKMTEEGKGKNGAPIFRDTLISNLGEIVDVLPKLNPTGDPDLTRLAEEARLRLAGMRPGDLRDYPAKRTEAAQAADDLCKKMAAFM